MEPQSNYVFDIKYLNGKVVFNMVVPVIFHSTFCYVVFFLENRIKPPYLHRQGGKKIENLHKKSANCLSIRTKPFVSLFLTLRTRYNQPWMMTDNCL